MKKPTVRQAPPAARRRTPTGKPTDLGDLLADLSGIFGPPGREDEVRRRVVREIHKLADHVDISPLGAVHAIVGRGSQPRMMIASQMDEVGVIVSHVDPSGFARFSLLGYKDPASLVGHAVRFSGGLVAVIRAESAANSGTGETDKLFLDFGGDKPGQVGVKVGDVGCLDSGQHRLGDRFVCSNAGGRSGVVVLLRTLQSLGGPSGELQFVFSVQGEFGGDGGLTSATALGPQAAIVVGPAPADDKPGSSNQRIRLGDGPVIALRHGSTPSDPRLVEALASLAKKNKIGYQSATLESSLPGSAIPAALGGVMAAWVCLPCRGLGTTSEMVDLGDIAGCARLLTALAQSRQEWM